MFKTIVIPLDGSPLSEQVLPKAAELAKCFPDAKFVLLEAIRPMTPSGIDALVLANSSELEPLTPEPAMDYLRQVAAKYFPGMHVRIMVEEGGPAEVILKTAKDVKADLIAMASHGRSGVARLTLGSVTDHVINRADVPVLVVKAK